MFSLKKAWNCNMRLKYAVKRAASNGIPKETVVQFWKDSARKYGYSGSYPNSPKSSSPPLSRQDLIYKYTSPTGMFGNYAEWCGNSVSYYLKQAGYEPLSKKEQEHYRCH